ncbi:MAG: MarR family winged helix-turn-helix transcriptional regulator [Ruminococcus sp.]
MCDFFEEAEEVGAVNSDDFHICDAIGHEIKAVNHIIHRKMLESAVKNGVDKVTIMHGWIIAYLYNNQDKDIFQKNLEREFSISRSSVTNILQLMEKKGYIKRVSVENDARLKKIVLTEKGISIKNSMDQAIKSNEQEFDSVFTPEEKQTFLFLIRKLRAGISG